MKKILLSGLTLHTNSFNLVLFMYDDLTKPPFLNAGDLY